MALPAQRDGSYSSLMILLLAGLSILAWISTYSGMLYLIEAGSGDIGLGAKIAIAFAVLMLQGMIIYILDALFSGQLRFSLYPLYILGYVVLFLISVAFAFGFYWRFLEAGAQTAQAAGSSVYQVQRSLQNGQSRLELLQTALSTLATVSSQKAQIERTAGGTCPASRAGDGPRRRLRESDAQRFQFANDLIASRTGAVKTDIADLNTDLQRILKKDPATIDPQTGTRTAFIEGLDRKLGLVTERFNALKTDPQFRQLRDELQARGRQTSFPDERGGIFPCPDGQLQTALNGVVRSIDELPQLQKPELRSVEGSEAVTEAFRRLSNTATGLIFHGKAPPSPERIRAEQAANPSATVTQDEAGLSDRDYIPLLIAIFVDVCILLVSINRPFGPFFNLGQDLARAQARGPMRGVLNTFYRVFQDQFDAQTPPVPADLIAPLQDVVFDHGGQYYAAVPLDFREENYDLWARARTNAPSYESSRALERSRYLAAVFAILEGERLVRLLGVERRSRFRRDEVDGLDEEAVRRKLDRQGSMYAQADAFRIYRFRPGKWAELLIQTVGSVSARAEERRGLPLSLRRLPSEVASGAEQKALPENNEPSALPGSDVEPPRRLPDRSRVE
ncbi:hypothetical protein T281_01105 [Rhodomicrobium udaipurense JA643]|uniref:Uncharacterized protein n=1 Tax=Rhodomicrobium udaipurense TaxID=1202716 RepID=A0A8I1GI43_9HYPH|nr:hypothetical protein [Rhodomicrobium udaipurense]KAI96251.1 hypothetical protein T281_01105 [Rhodomicrobium udaipurense JA643]MBJ7544776.1 hypothetical protein [Rhodomicrobium udaipurense]